MVFFSVSFKLVYILRSVSCLLRKSATYVLEFENARSLMYSCLIFIHVQVQNNPSSNYALGSFMSKTNEWVKPWSIFFLLKCIKLILFSITDTWYITHRAVYDLYTVKYRLSFAKSWKHNYLHCLKYRNYTKFPGVKIMWKHTVPRRHTTSFQRL